MSRSAGIFVRLIKGRLATLREITYEVAPQTRSSSWFGPGGFRGGKHGPALSFPRAVLCFSRNGLRLIRTRNLGLGAADWLPGNAWRLSPVFIEQISELEKEIDFLGNDLDGLANGGPFFLPNHLLSSGNLLIRSTNPRRFEVEISLVDFGGYGHFLAEILPVFLWSLRAGWTIGRITGERNYVAILEKISSESDQADACPVREGPIFTGGIELVNKYHYPSAQSINLVRNLTPIKQEKMRRPRRLYIPRDRGVARSRYVANEPEIRELLSRHGFETFTPEQFSLEEQAQAFSDAEIVLGVHGSGLFNVCFMKKNSVVIEIAPGSDYRWGVVAICIIAGLKHRVVWGAANDTKGNFEVSLESLDKEITEALSRLDEW